MLSLYPWEIGVKTVEFFNESRSSSTSVALMAVLLFSRAAMLIVEGCREKWFYTG